MKINLNFEKHRILAWLAFGLGARIKFQHLVIQPPTLAVCLAPSGVGPSGLISNNLFHRCELATMIPHVTPRFLFYLAALLVALLPLEATYAANGCAPVAAMADHGDGCGDCMDDARDQCQSYCLALCQSLLAGRVASPEARDLSSLIYQPLLVKFPPLPDGGPEPPPPRIPR